MFAKLLLIFRFVYSLFSLILMIGIYRIFYQKRDKEGLIGLRFIELFSQRLPKKIEEGRKIGGIYGKIFYKLNLGTRKCLINLHIAFGREKPPDEIQEILKKYYIFLSTHLFELFYFYQMSPEEIKKRIHYKPQELEAIQTKYKTSGFQISTYHSCQLNLTCSILGLFFENFFPHATQQPNLSLDLFLDKIRVKCHALLIKKTQFSAVKLLKKVKTKQIIGVACDYNTENPEFFLPFFGLEASVVASAYFFVQHTLCPLIFVKLLPIGEGNYRIQFKEISYNASLPAEQMRKQMVELYFQELEQVIREFPEQYIWHNQRWHTRPTGDSYLIYKMNLDELTNYLKKHQNQS